MAGIGDKMTIAVTHDGETWTQVDGFVQNTCFHMPHDGVMVADLSIVGQDVTKVLDGARLMEMRNPLYPCTWCGTWKARKCSCPKCGAPDKL